MKLKTFFVVIVFLALLVPTYVWADGVVFDWVKLYPECPECRDSLGGTGQGMGVAVDLSGNVYVTGFNFGPYWARTESGYTTVKYDSNGTRLWDRRYVTGYDGYGHVAITVDTLGHVYVIGNSGMIKYDTNGNELWVRPGGTALAVDSFGNVYVTGGNGTTKYDSA